MTEFEYLFAFYSLLLGLALANVATGLADVWRSRHEASLGICIPLLAAVVISYSVSQWQLMWENRDNWVMGPPVLLATLGVLLPYIFISQAMFPKKPEAWATLDEYYLANREILLGAMIFATGVALLANFLLLGEWGLGPLIRTVFTIIAPAVAIFIANRWLHAAVLLAMSAYYILFRLL